MRVQYLLLFWTRSSTWCTGCVGHHLHQAHQPNLTASSFVAEFQTMSTMCAMLLDVGCLPAYRLLEKLLRLMKFLARFDARSRSVWQWRRRSGRSQRTKAPGCTTAGCWAAAWQPPMFLLPHLAVPQSSLNQVLYDLICDM